LVSSILSFSGWLFTPDGDGDSGVGEDEDGDGEEVLEDHQRQTVTQLRIFWWPSKLKQTKRTVFMHNKMDVTLVFTIIQQ
jgi:hypothetical protein